MSNILSINIYILKSQCWETAHKVATQSKQHKLRNDAINHFTWILNINHKPRKILQKKNINFDVSKLDVSRKHQDRGKSVGLLPQQVRVCGGVTGMEWTVGWHHRDWLTVREGRMTARQEVKESVGLYCERWREADLWWWAACRTGPATPSPFPGSSGRQSSSRCAALRRLRSRAGERVRKWGAQTEVPGLWSGRSSCKPKRNIIRLRSRHQTAQRCS